MNGKNELAPFSGQKYKIFSCLCFTEEKEKCDKVCV